MSIIKCRNCEDNKFCKLNEECVMNKNIKIDTTKRIKCYGWINNNQEIQNITFNTIQDAIKEMCKRLSLDYEDGYSLQHIYGLGFKLVYLDKTIKINKIIEMV